MRTLDFGKNSGKILQNCDEKYLKWLVSHEQVLAERNRWASRDAKFALAKQAEIEKAQADFRKGKVFCKELGEWVELPSDGALDIVRDSRWGYAIERQAKDRDKALMRNEITDISSRGSLYRNQGFQLMR